MGRTSSQSDESARKRRKLEAYSSVNNAVSSPPVPPPPSNTPIPTGPRAEALVPPPRPIPYQSPTQSPYPSTYPQPPPQASASQNPPLSTLPTGPRAFRDKVTIGASSLSIIPSNAVGPPKGPRGINFNAPARVLAPSMRKAFPGDEEEEEAAQPVQKKKVGGWVRDVQLPSTATNGAQQHDSAPSAGPKGFVKAKETGRVVEEKASYVRPLPVSAPVTKDSYPPPPPPPRPALEPTLPPSAIRIPLPSQSQTHAQQQQRVLEAHHLPFPDTPSSMDIDSGPASSLPSPRPEPSAESKAVPPPQSSIAPPPRNEAAAPASAAPKSDELYDRLSQVGEGTYGKVYKARNVETGVLVALKRIRMEAEKDGFPVTAIREIKLLQGLRHENVVSLHEMVVSKGHVYMVLEYVDHDLTGVLHHPDIHFLPSHLKSLMQQFLTGLGFIHSSGVLHRDLKGSNILVSRDGKLKIADFGLARYYRRGRGVDYTNRVITQWYKPPELLFGTTVYGAEVDMWSAGCIFLELFTERPVFTGDDEIDQLDKIFRITGTPDIQTWPGVEDLPWYALVQPKKVLPSRLKKDFEKSVGSAGALDLAERLLSLNPAGRPTAEEALLMPYFTTEAPPPELPDILSSIEGEWHEYESKLARGARRKAAAAAENKVETVGVPGSGPLKAEVQT